MECFYNRSAGNDQGAITLVLDLAKAFERVSLPVVRAWSGQRRVQFEGYVADPLQTVTAILPASKWSSLVFHIVLLDASSEVMKVYPLVKLQVSVDDIYSLLGRTKQNSLQRESVSLSLFLEVNNLWIGEEISGEGAADVEEEADL